MRLVSFVWPDQAERHERLAAALAVATDHPPLVDTGSADTWVVSRLSRERPHATVVFHSIVWQYLGRTVQDGMRRALEEAGAATTADPPLVWVRMEPAGPVADVRATVWTGGIRTDHVLAEIGYHGQHMRWLGA
jgi:hypothetical protein